MPRKRDIKQVRDLCRMYRHVVSPDEEYGFLEYLHECKESGDGGSDDGDYTWDELKDKLKEYLGVESLS